MVILVLEGQTQKDSKTNSSPSTTLDERNNSLNITHGPKEAISRNEKKLLNDQEREKNGDSDDPDDSFLVRPTLMESLATFETKKYDKIKNKRKYCSQEKENTALCSSPPPAIELYDTNEVLFYTPTHQVQDEDGFFLDDDEDQQGEEQKEILRTMKNDKESNQKSRDNGSSHLVALQSKDLLLLTTNLEELERLKQERDRNRNISNTDTNARSWFYTLPRGSFNFSHLYFPSALNPLSYFSSGTATSNSNSTSTFTNIKDNQENFTEGKNSSYEDRKASQNIYSSNNQSEEQSEERHYNTKQHSFRFGELHQVDNNNISSSNGNEHIDDDDENSSIDSIFNPPNSDSNDLPIINMKINKDNRNNRNNNDNNTINNILEKNNIDGNGDTKRNISDNKTNKSCTGNTSSLENQIWNNVFPNRDEGPEGVAPFFSPVNSIHSIQSLESITSLHQALKSGSSTSRERNIHQSSGNVTKEESLQRQEKKDQEESSIDHYPFHSNSNSTKLSEEEQDSKNTDDKNGKSEVSKKGLLRRIVSSKKFYKKFFTHSFSMKSLNAYHNEVLRRKEYQDMDEAFNIEKNEDDNIYHYPSKQYDDCLYTDYSMELQKSSIKKNLFFNRGFRDDLKNKKDGKYKVNSSFNDSDSDRIKSHPKRPNGYQGGIMLDIRLLGRPYTLTLKVSAGLLPVSLILTELFRLYVSEHLFHEDMQQGEEEELQRNQKNQKNKRGPKQKILSKQPFIDLHYLVPACKGLLQLRDGILFTVNDKIIIDESISFETYIVVIDLHCAAAVTLPQGSFSEIDSDFLDTIRSFQLEHDRTGKQYKSSGEQDIRKEISTGRSIENSTKSLEGLAAKLTAVEIDKKTIQQKNSDSVQFNSQGRIVKFKNYLPLLQLPHFRHKTNVSDFLKNLLIPNSSVKLEANKEKGEKRKNFVSEPDTSDILVRGLNYLIDKKKVPSVSTAYHLIGLDFLEVEDYHGNLSSRENSFANRLQKLNLGVSPYSLPFVVCLNFVLPEENFTGYFIPGHGGTSPFVGEQKFDCALQRFLLGDQTYRNSRLKIVPRCVEGPWAVKSAVGSKPAIIGKKISQRYYQNFTDEKIKKIFSEQYSESTTNRDTILKGDTSLSGNIDDEVKDEQVDLQIEPDAEVKSLHKEQLNFLEIEIDITSSLPAQYILGMVKGYSTNVAIDLAFIIQGEGEEELPERVWFALRINQIDFRNLMKTEEWEGRPF